MNTGSFYEPLNLSMQFLENINNRKEQNDNETKLFNYENKNITPPFRYYKDDTNLKLNPKFIPSFTYKNKSLFGSEKPLQTEHDIIGINQGYLNKHFGYTDYGNFLVANQSLPENNKHKKTPKNNLFELI